MQTERRKYNFNEEEIRKIRGTQSGVDIWKISSYRMPIKNLITSYTEALDQHKHQKYLMLIFLLHFGLNFKLLNRQIPSKIMMM